MCDWIAQANEHSAASSSSQSSAHAQHKVTHMLCAHFLCRRCVRTSLSARNLAVIPGWELGLGFSTSQDRWQERKCERRGKRCFRRQRAAEVRDGGRRQRRSMRLLSSCAHLVPFPNPDQTSTTKISATRRCLKPKPAATRKLQLGQRASTIFTAYQRLVVKSGVFLVPRRVGDLPGKSTTGCGFPNRWGFASFPV